MLLKTPHFWYRPFGPLSALLYPISLLYSIGSNLKKNTSEPRCVDLPVICIGNIVAGGSGKTPTAIALFKILKELSLFKTPYFLTRGYGGKTKSARRITGHEPANDVGDEPLLLSQKAQTIVSIDRFSGAEFALKEGADCVLMDDGFQNFSLHKDLSFIVIDGAKGLGNGSLIPAGPLREKPENAFQRADAVVLIGEDKLNVSDLIPDTLPIFTAYIKPLSDNHNREDKYVAFAGLAHPDKFKTTLISHGYNVLDFIDYPDHYPYTELDINHLKELAERKGARLITTEKDYVRLSPKLQNNIDVLPIELVWQDKEAISNFLLSHFERSQ